MASKRILILGQEPYTAIESFFKKDSRFLTQTIIVKSTDETAFKSLIKEINNNIDVFVSNVPINENDPAIKTRSVGCSILDTPFDVVKTIYKPEKKKGHKRPYKYHP